VLPRLVSHHAVAGYGFAQQPKELDRGSFLGEIRYPAVEDLHGVDITVEPAADARAGDAVEAFHYWPVGLLVLGVAQAKGDPPPAASADLGLAADKVEGVGPHWPTVKALQGLGDGRGRLLHRHRQTVSSINGNIKAARSAVKASRRPVVPSCERNTHPARSFHGDLLAVARPKLSASRLRRASGGVTSQRPPK